MATGLKETASQRRPWQPAPRQPRQHGKKRASIREQAQGCPFAGMVVLCCAVLHWAFARVFSWCCAGRLAGCLAGRHGAKQGRGKRQERGMLHRQGEFLQKVQVVAKKSAKSCGPCNRCNMPLRKIFTMMLPDIILHTSAHSLFPAAAACMRNVSGTCKKGHDFQSVVFTPLFLVRRSNPYGGQRDQHPGY